MKRGVYVSIFYTFLHLLSLLLGILLGALFGCGELNEGSAPDCAVGDLVYGLTMIM